ncbi:MAG: hypothetical protein R2854_26265 [Caldilineaceae bacterium]
MDHFLAQFAVDTAAVYPYLRACSKPLPCSRSTPDSPDHGSLLRLSTAWPTPS